MEMPNTEKTVSFLWKIMKYKSTRILFMIGFFLFMYQILYAMGSFFAIDTLILSMYMCWIAMFVIFSSFLPIEKALIYNIEDLKTDVPNVVNPISTALT